MKRYIYCILILWAFGITASAQNNLQTTPQGAQYIIFTPNTGDKIKLDDVITLQVIQKTDKDSVLFSTYAQGSPVKLQVQPSQSLTDLMDIFPLLAVNDSVLVKIPADSVFKGHEDKRPPFLPTGSHLNFYIKVLKIQSLTEAIDELKSAEIVAANKYIADNKLIVKTTPSGLKYVITKLGLKPRPQSDDTVLVNYTGKLLNGQVFDSNIEAVAKQNGMDQPGRTYEPLKITLGQQQVIKGWDEGLLLIHEGGKATLIVPSSLAYGEQGAGQGAIPPFSTLVFDVEIVKVKRIPHPVAKKPLTHHHPLVKKTN